MIFLENAKYVKVSNHHKLKLDKGNLNFPIFCVDTEYGKMLKNAEKHENIWQNSHKSFASFFFKDFAEDIYTLEHHMTSHKRYQLKTKRKIEVHWNKYKKNASYCCDFKPQSLVILK